MKVSVVAACAVLALSATDAYAQSANGSAGDASADGVSPFDGFKIGGTVDYRRHEGKFDAPTTKQRVDKQEGGFGYRGFVGVDKVIANFVVAGAEAGIGNGGRDLKATGAAGRYSLDPQWSWDVSGRLGVTPSSGVMVYGRAGYAWMRTHEKLVDVAVDQSVLDRRRTRDGVLWGVGAEFAVTHHAALRTEFNQTNFSHGLKAARVQIGGALRF